jgi:hypothetical protein
MLQGSNVWIYTTLLSTSDPDTNASLLVYTVTSTLGGGVHLINIGGVCTTFTQAQLAANVVYFQHDGSNAAVAGFNFTVTDGSTTTPEQLFNIVVLPSPPYLVNMGATVYEVMFDPSASWICPSAPLHSRSLTHARIHLFLCS